MGVITKVILVDPRACDNLPKLDTSNIPRKEVMDSPALSPYKLAKLYSALTGESTHKRAKQQVTILDESASKDEWIYQFSSAMVQHLASLELSSIPTVARKWLSLASEEFEVEGWPIETVVARVTQLRDICKRALQLSKMVVLRIIL